MKRLSFLLALLFPLLIPRGADAHGLGMEATVKNGKLVVSAFYDDDTDAVGARVQIVSGSTTIATGKTDTKGQCRLDLPPAGKYQVTVDAGAGHRTQQSITIPADVGRSTPAAGRPTEHDARSEGKTESQDGVADGPTRREFTAYPWLKIGIGIGVIGLLALAFLLSRVFRTPS